MKRFREIIQSTVAPGTSDLWINEDKLKYFKDGRWVTIGGNSNISWDDIQDKPTIPSKYTLPAASNRLGGVRIASAVHDIDITETTTIEAVATTVNTLLSALRNSGVLTA